MEWALLPDVETEDFNQFFSDISFKVMNNEIYFRNDVQLYRSHQMTDQSLLCPHEESLGPKLANECTAKTLIRLGGCPDWSESSLGSRYFVGFVMRRLIEQKHDEKTSVPLEVLWV